MLGNRGTLVLVGGLSVRRLGESNSRRLFIYKDLCYGQISLTAGTFKVTAHQLVKSNVPEDWLSQLRVLMFISFKWSIIRVCRMQGA